MKKRVAGILSKDKILYTIAVVIFIIITAWFLCIHCFNLNATLRVRQAWGSVYQVMAIYGCIIGFIASKKWDGYKSLIGRAILYFSVGLLLQSFGQSVDSYYNFFANQAIPYPSLGDIGFFGSVIAYIAGALVLLKATGFQLSVKSTKKKLVIVIIPLIVLISCYAFFLNGYVFDWSNKIKIILDFGYPLGQASYISIVLVAYVTSWNYSLGAMKRPLFFLLIALAFQYLSDFTFLYQANAGTWYVGGLNDYMYFVAYFCMTLALLNMASIRRKLPEEL